ncbi:MAG: primosomal protein N' [Clostridia bacterium]|nr:primosomal protein N' [Clostridia bacterium]
MKVGAVLIDNTTKDFDKVYYYEVPESLENSLVTGVRVNVPFGRGNSIRLAYFLDFVEKETNKDQYKLKQIINIVDSDSVISKNQIKLAKEIKDKYFCTYSQAINMMIPTGAKIKKEKYVLIDGKKIKLSTYMKNHSPIDYSLLTVIEEEQKNVNSRFVKRVKLAVSRENAAELIESYEFNNEKQIRLIELLLDYDTLTVSDLQNYENISSSTVNTLSKKGFVTVFEQEEQRKPLTMTDLETFVPDQLSYHQEQAVSRISDAFESDSFNRFLIKGITGSGKTEIYLQLARKVIEKGKQVIILVPEISLTPIMIRRFMGRFGNEVAVLHSRLSVVERYEEWKKIKDKKVSIALGARSCVFAPFDQLGLIIIDEEHETSYKSETTPKYSAVDVANMRCRIDKCVLVLGSATPSVTTYHLFKKEDAVITIDERVTKEQLPQVSIVDMKEEFIKNNRSIFSEKLQEEIRKNIENKEQTMLFLNRRGYENFYLCRDCGEVIKCDACDVSMTYHKNRNRLFCHYCGLIKHIPEKCPSCGESHIASFGVGTEKVEEQIKEIFEEATVLRMDLDTTGYKNSHVAILDQFRNENVNILIGTQMIAKGHDFGNVTLVGILAADTLTKGFSIFSEERAFQLITQAVGRSGRGEKEGRAVIQAYDVDNHAITFGVKQDYYDFYAYEMAVREQLLYPPFGIIGKIILSGSYEKDILFWMTKAENLLKEMHVDVSYKAKDPVSMINNNYRYRVVVKGYNSSELLKKMRSFYNYIYRKLPKSVKCSIDIDGIDMI